VTNFSPKTDYQGLARKLASGRARTGRTSLEYTVTIEDPTVWVQPWTVTQVFSQQNDQQNRIYYEPLL